MPPLTDDKQLAVSLINVDEIYIDEDFNTRSAISPLDVLDLAKSIKKHGLQQPIVVRHRKADEPIPPQYVYVVVAGHRRLTAYQVNQDKEIPAIIRDGLSEFDYRTINAIENLKRSDLNLLEQANCIRHYVEQGYSREDIAQELGMSPGWVQIREMVLDLPSEIQAEVAKGTFTATQIRELNTYKKDPGQQILVAKGLKEAKQKGENKTAEQILKKPPKAATKKQRSAPELKQIMLLYKNTFGKFDLTTRIIAWAIGEIDNAQLYLSFAETAKERGVPFNMPDMEF